MITGYTPFPGIEMYTVSPRVINGEIEWPKEPIDPVCRDLIEKLLQINQKDRLGAVGTDHDMEELMKHPFFKGIDFNTDLTDLGIKDLLDQTLVKEQKLSNSSDQPQNSSQKI